MATLMRLFPSLYHQVTTKIFLKWESSMTIQIDLGSPQCMFNNIYHYINSVRKSVQSGYNEKILPQCIYSGDHLDLPSLRKPYHNGDIYMASHWCGSSYVYQNFPSVITPYHIGCTDKDSPKFAILASYQAA